MQKKENFYSEIASTSQPGKDTTIDAKAMCAYSELKDTRVSTRMSVKDKQEEERRLSLLKKHSMMSL